MTRPMEFSILGPLDVRAGGQTISTGASKEWALLTLLLLNADRVVPVVIRTLMARNHPDISRKHQ